MQIHLDNTHTVGMGDYLCLLSMLCDMRELVEVFVDERWGTYEKLCNIQNVLNIPKRKLTFSLSNTSGSFPITGWPLKLFSPYFSTETVNVLGQTLSTDPHAYHKEFIGICAYNGTGMWMDNDRNIIELNQFKPVNLGNTNNWPGCRYHPLDYWAEVYKSLQTKNFDLIDLDGGNMSLEEKVYFMVKHCKAIIGYEGGMAHLAHILKIPCFILNWNIPTPNTELDDFHVEVVHQSPYMYVLRPETELLSWTHEQLDQKISALRRGEGNNRITNKTVNLTFPLGIKNNLVITDLGNNQMLKAGGVFGDQIIDVIRHTHGWKFSQNV
jgi:hypothetical protein